jgi:predicted acylesterase/phospholipase RssA
MAQSIFSKNLIDRMDPYNIIRKAGMFLRVNKSLYSPSTLQTVLTETFSTDAKLFSLIQASGMSYSTKVAVTAAKDASATRCLFASYNRPDLRGSHDFEREETDSTEIKIWEAARATSAAPFFFPPFIRVGTEYVDGGLYANCPAEVALLEKDNIWAENNAPLDVLVSIGTGTQNRPDRIPSIIRVGGFEKIMATFFRSLETDPMWKQLVDRTRDRTTEGRLLRLNPKLEGNYIALDDTRKMENLEEMVESQLKDSSFKTILQQTANMLLASLFFFEPDENYASLATINPYPLMPYAIDPHRIPGTIRCRLRGGSQELINLLEKVDSFWYWYPEIHHALGPEDLNSEQHHSWYKVPGFENWRNDMFNSHRTSSFFRLPHEFHSTSRFLLVLAVSWKDNDAKYPISGFPMTMEDLLQRAASH